MRSPRKRRTPCQRRFRLWAWRAHTRCFMFGLRRSVDDISWTSDLTFFNNVIYRLDLSAIGHLIPVGDVETSFSEELVRGFGLWKNLGQHQPTNPAESPVPTCSNQAPSASHRQTQGCLQLSTREATLPATPSPKASTQLGGESDTSHPRHDTLSSTRPAPTQHAPPTLRTRSRGRREQQRAGVGPGQRFLPPSNAPARRHAAGAAPGRQPADVRGRGGRDPGRCCKCTPPPPPRNGRPPPLVSGCAPRGPTKAVCQSAEGHAVWLTSDGTFCPPSL